MWRRPEAKTEKFSKNKLKMKRTISGLNLDIAHEEARGNRIIEKSDKIDRGKKSEKSEKKIIMVIVEVKE